MNEISALIIQSWQQRYVHTLAAFAGMTEEGMNSA
jgi:hypothetical protein